MEKEREKSPKLINVQCCECIPFHQGEINLKVGEDRFQKVTFIEQVCSCAYAHGTWVCNK